MSYQALTLAVQPLSRVVCIHLDVHIWSGRKKLRPEDLGRLSGTFPPPDFASLGSKKVCDPAALAVFHRLYRRAHRLCERVGIHFMKGYAIPETAIETVLLELDELHEAFKVCLDEFLLTYEQDIRSWASAHPGYEQAVLRVMDSPETVRARTWFAWQAFRIRCDSQEESALMHQGISQLAQGMAGQLFHEVSQAAKQLFDGSFAGQEACSRKVVQCIEALLGKLNGLAFLDHRVMPLVHSLQQTLCQLPRRGPYREKAYWALRGLVNILSDGQAMIDYGEGVLSAMGEQVDPVRQKPPGSVQNDWIEEHPVFPGINSGSEPDWSRSAPGVVEF